MKYEPLKNSEVTKAKKRGLFTVTVETDRGYRVQLFSLRKGVPRFLQSSRECVRPRTARRYAILLVRAALAMIMIGCGGVPFTTLDAREIPDADPTSEAATSDAPIQATDSGPSAPPDTGAIVIDSGDPRDGSAPWEASAADTGIAEAGQPMPDAPPDAPCETTPSTWTCGDTSPNDSTIEVSGPGSYCRRFRNAAGGLTAVAQPTPITCLACGEYTCACVLQSATDPCPGGSVQRCDDTQGGPAVVCQ